MLQVGNFQSALVFLFHDCATRTHAFWPTRKGAENAERKSSSVVCIFKSECVVIDLMRQNNATLLFVFIRCRRKKQKRTMRNEEEMKRMEAKKKRRNVSNILLCWASAYIFFHIMPYSYSIQICLPLYWIDKFEETTAYYLYWVFISIVRPFSLAPDLCCRYRM